LAIVEKAMSVLQAESQDRGETKRFEVLRRWLIPFDDGAIAALAVRSLDMSDGAFKVAVHRLRKRFRQLVKDRIALSVDGPEALQRELDYLIQALTASEASHDSSTCRLTMLSGKINPSQAVSHPGAAESRFPSQQRPPKKVQ
jgi:hypothetical protein